MNRTLPCCAAQGVTHSVYLAMETKAVLASSSFAQRRAFLTALLTDLNDHRDLIRRAARHDNEMLSLQHPHHLHHRAMATASPSPPPLHEAVEGLRSTGTTSSPAASPAAAATDSSPAELRSAAAPQAYSPSFSHQDHWPPAPSPDLSGGSAAALAPAAFEARCRRGAVVECPSSDASDDSSNPRPTDHHRSHLCRPSDAEAPPPPGRRESTVSTTPWSPSSTGGDAAAGGLSSLFSPPGGPFSAPLRLDHLSGGIQYLLLQNDPIAVPKPCWLHREASRHRHRDACAAAEAHCSAAAPAVTGHRRRHSSSSKKEAESTRATANSPGRLGGPSSVEVHQISVPLGIVGVLSRFQPRLCLDAVAMGIFCGNAVLMDGGATARFTNLELAASVRRALRAAGLPLDAMILVEDDDTAHEATNEWLQLSDFIDLAVVCGPPKLHRFASRQSAIPLLKATDQCSSLYIDQSAAFQVAVDAVLRSKRTQMGVVNGVTSIVIHRQFPRFAELLLELASHGAILLGDEVANEIVPGCFMGFASDEEYGGWAAHGSSQEAAPVLCVKSVDSLDQALYFIETFGSKQSDGVIATDPAVCATFCAAVDSAIVVVNAPTRLPVADGSREAAISASKLHCRGPLTTQAMTTRKYVVRGTPQLQESENL